MKDEAIFISKWKNEIKNLIKMRFGKLDKDKIDNYLDEVIANNMRNPKAFIENNYTNMTAKADVLSIIDLIEKNKLIIGGGGVLFQQHNLKENPLIGYIEWTMAQRNVFKKERKKYEKYTDEWFTYEIGQGRMKVKVNSLRQKII